MLVVNGFFENGSPALKLRIGSSASSAAEYVGIIDTGFTGFLSIPTEFAEQLTLNYLNATAEEELADGSIHLVPLAEGVAFFNDREVSSNNIILEDGSKEVLVGKDFLRNFKLTLVISATNVILVDEEEMTKAISKIVQTAGRLRKTQSAS